MTVRAPIGRRGPAVVAMAVGALVTVVGSWLPWVRTGSARRHSYDVFALVERLGFAPDGPAATALRWWPLMPLLAVMAVVGAWWGWPRIGGVAGVVAGLYAGLVGLAVTMAPDAALVGIEAGAPITAVGGLVLVAASVAVTIVGGSGSAVRASRPTSPGR